MENPVQYFATTGTDGKPKVRPFQFALERGGKLWFCTNSKKNVYNEMQAQPYVEVCACSPDYTWIRLSGKAVFENDMDVKAEIIERSPLVKSKYKDAANPIFEVFYIAQAKAVFADFSGNPPKEYTL
jgi:uncharacterized pyridoxamine 5'-phosphate oxidase family protein